MPFIADKGVRNFNHRYNWDFWVIVGSSTRGVLLFYFSVISEPQVYSRNIGLLMFRFLLSMQQRGREQGKVKAVQCKIGRGTIYKKVVGLIHWTTGDQMVNNSFTGRCRRLEECYEITEKKEKGTSINPVSRTDVG